MDLFPDTGFVRLRSSVWGTYLHADEDGVGVSLRPERGSRNTVWKVHQTERNDIPLILLYGVTYGRYLAATSDWAPIGLRGRRVVQGTYDDLEQNNVVWSATRVERGGNEVRLQLVSHLRLLRANGNHFKRARTGVSADSYANSSPMMHWVVEAVPPLPSPPAYVTISAKAPVQPRKGIIGLFRKRAKPAPEVERKVRYVMADDYGTYDDGAWTTFRYRGRSAYYLRNAVANRLGYDLMFFVLSICARSGRYGRLTPLIADLPRSQATLDIIVVVNKTPVEAGLRYPDLDAE